MSTDEMFAPTADNTETMSELLIEITLKEDEASRIADHCKMLREQLLELMKQNGVSTIKIENTSLAIRTHTDTNITKKKDVPAEDVIKWLENNNLGGIIKRDPYYNAATLKSALKDEIEADRPVPESMFNVFTITSLRYNPGKSKYLDAIQEIARNRELS